jgi:PPOX class probable F420-dependent enzyme
MPIQPEHRAFLDDHHAAAMITVGGDGRPKVARVGVVVVDGRVWSSGTRDRSRTARLRRDPRCTLYVHDAATSWVALESTVAILDGPDAAEQNLRLFRLLQGKPTGPLSWFGGEHEEADFLRVMREEGRLIFEFAVERSYGLLAPG